MTLSIITRTRKSNNSPDNTLTPPLPVAKEIKNKQAKVLFVIIETHLFQQPCILQHLNCYYTRGTRYIHTAPLAALLLLPCGLLGCTIADF